MVGDQQGPSFVALQQLPVANLTPFEHGLVAFPPTALLPPTLSYKNHAIDEFLLDYVRLATLPGRGVPPAILRVGGNANLAPELARYTEANYRRTDFEVTSALRTLNDAIDQRRRCHQMKQQLNLQILSGWQWVRPVCGNTGSE